MSDSDSTVLENYKLARDALIAAIIAGENIVRLVIRGREVETSDPQKTLELVEREIVRYEQRVKVSTSASNLVRFKKT